MEVIFFPLPPRPFSNGSLEKWSADLQNLQKWVFSFFTKCTAFNPTSPRWWRGRPTFRYLSVQYLDFLDDTDNSSIDEKYFVGIDPVLSPGDKTMSFEDLKNWIPSRMALSTSI